MVEVVYKVNISVLKITVEFEDFFLKLAQTFYCITKMASWLFRHLKNSRLVLSVHSRRTDYVNQYEHF